MKLSEITCPRCSKVGTWTPENKSRPFCSERCKLIDLGDWASEKHRVAGDPADPTQTPGEEDKEE